MYGVKDFVEVNKLKTSKRTYLILRRVFKVLLGFGGYDVKTLQISYNIEEFVAQQNHF